MSFFFKTKNKGGGRIRGCKISTGNYTKYGVQKKRVKPVIKL